jgi:hypothetical protein
LHSSAASSSRHASETIFKGNGKRNDYIAGGILVDPRLDLGEVLVLLANEIPLRQVDEVDDGFGGEKEELVDDLDL